MYYNIYFQATHSTSSLVYSWNTFCISLIMRILRDDENAFPEGNETYLCTAILYVLSDLTNVKL